MTTKNNTWGYKQVVPMKVYHLLDGDNWTLEWELFLILWFRTASEDKLVTTKKGKTLLNRGQFIYGLRELAVRTKRSKNSVEIALKKVQKLVQIEVQKSNAKGTVAEFQNYDEMISFGTVEGTVVGLVEGQKRDSSGVLTTNDTNDTNVTIVTKSPPTPPRGVHQLGEAFASQKASLGEDKDGKIVTPAVNTFGEKPQYPLNEQQITDACQPLPNLLPWIRYWHKRYDIDQEVLTFELEKIAIWMEKKDAKSINELFLDSWMAKVPNHKKFGKQILKDEFVGSVPYTEFTNDGKLAIHAIHKIREGSSGKGYYRQHYYFTKDEWELILANNKK